MVGPEYHNENFLDGVLADMKPYTLQSPIFRYNVSFEQNSTYAGLMLAHGSKSDYNSYNPAVITGPVAAQLGGYLVQLNLNEEIFARMDAYRPQSTQVSAEKSSDENGLAATLPQQQGRARVWASPYAAFGKVPLKNGPKVSNKLYGTAAGIDSPLYDIGRDWNGVGSFYVAYNGSYQKFDGVSMEQNGAGVGISDMAYKDDFYAGFLVGGAMSDVKTKAGYGRENSSILTAAVATKAGYSWELGASGQWLLEPELLASYTWIHTPSYTNEAGVRIHEDPLQTYFTSGGVRNVGVQAGVSYSL